MPKVNKSVEKQAELADQLYQQMYGKTDSAPVKEEADTQNVQPKESETPPAEAPADAQPAPVAEQTPVENADQQPKPKFPDADPNDPSWEQKYKVIANKYSAEVPRYAAEIRSLKEELTSLKARLDSQAQTPTPAPQRVKPEEVEEYGEKFYDFVKRAASEVVPEGVDTLKQSVEEVRKEQTALARQRFFDELGGLSPEWRTLNEDRGFLDFLAELDPYTGAQRQQLFDDAYGKLDAWRIANFFNAYVQGQTKEAPPQKPSLETQVTPKTSGRSAPPQGKRVYSTADVARFYDDMRRGKFTADEAARIEQDIFAAKAEGRLR